jgi:putative ATP-binding cassette transporter
LGPKPFKPSIDWSAALTDSLRWTAIAWVIGAICLLIVLVVFRFFTPWGRQFWRITRGYFLGRASIKVWVMLGVLLLSVLLAVRLTVLLSYQGNDLYTAVQKAVQGTAAGNDEVRNSGIHGFWMSIIIFSILATIYVVRFMADIYLTQRFIIAWRIWLTAHLTDDWLDGRAYYRDLFIDNTIDNPDQRIQQDIDIFTANAGGTPTSRPTGPEAPCCSGRSVRWRR